MVYDSDFYTTRRPYSTYSSRLYPSVTSYSYSTPTSTRYYNVSDLTPDRTKRVAEEQYSYSYNKSSGSGPGSRYESETVRKYNSGSGLGPGSYSYSTERSTRSSDGPGRYSYSSTTSGRLPVPYTGHNRTTYVLPASTYHVVRVRPSVINRELKRFVSPTLHYLNSDPVVNFQDEARLIRLQAMSLLRQVHAPVPRIWSSLPKYITGANLERSHSPAYVYQMLTPTTPRHLTWHYDPALKPILRLTLPRSIGNAHHFAAVDFVGDKVHYRRQHPLMSDMLNDFENTVKNDVNLLSYYIKQKDHDDDEGNLSPSRPTRHFSSLKQLEFPEPSDELLEMRKERAERLARIRDDDDNNKTNDKRKSDDNVEKEIKCESKPEPEPEIVEEKEPEKSSFQKTDDEILKEERAAKRKRRQTNNMAQVKDKKRSSSSKSEGLDAKEIERLDQLAKEAEADKEAELARQAEELAELARQEAELARQEAELAELARQEAELAELARQEAELAELAKEEAELAAREEKERLEREELARQEAELVELERQARALEEREEEARRKAEEKERKKAMKEEAERKRIEEELAELARQEAELAELERQQQEIEEPEESTACQDEMIEEMKKDESEEQIVMDKDNEEEHVVAEEEDEVTENTEVLEQEQAELVALAKRAVQLAAMEAEAKELDISDENNNDFDGLKTPDDCEKSLADEEVLPDNLEVTQS